MNQTQYSFKSDEIESQLSMFASKGITQLTIHDEVFSNDKKKILSLLKAIQNIYPELFVTFLINPLILDLEICKQASLLNCSIEMPFLQNKQKQNMYLFDKKFFSKKASLLNNLALVFGVHLYYADSVNDTFKFFCDRVDFTVQQYPNHIDFPQTENILDIPSPKVSGIFSSEEIRKARNIAFACRTFYSAGRAVPWFLSVLYPLKISPSKFFSDFAEWQKVNNCDYKSGFLPEKTDHAELEKMQLLFLSLKYEEKNKNELFSIVNDIIKLNGAFSRLVGEGIESTITTKYHPEDLLSPEAMDIISFNNNVCMENCTVKVFLTPEGPDYKVV